MLILRPSFLSAETAGPPTDSTPLKKLSLEELSQIEVTTPSKEPEKAFRTPAAIYVITGDDIRRSGVTSIPEALRMAPGVEVARIDSNKWSIGIRGFGTRLTRDVLVLIDGRTVYTTLLAGTYWEVQDTMLEDVDRIEVIRGPGGTIWGPNAVNGVINIITKRSQETHGVVAAAGGGSVDQGFGEVRYGGGDDRLSYRLYGKAYIRGPEFHPDHRNFDDWRGVQGGFRADWNHTQSETFTLMGDVYAIRAGERVDATTYNPPANFVFENNARLSGGNILLRWDRNFSDRNAVEIQAYFDRTNRAEPNFADFRDTFDIDYVHHLKWRARQTFTWGLGGRVSPGNDVEVVSGLTFTPPQRTDQLLTAFVQDEIGLIENRLSLTIGSKFLHTNFTNFAPEPSARVLWTPTSSTSVWAAATHAVRTPSDAEHDFNLSSLLTITPSGVPFFARFSANKNFRPEQMNGYELGFRQLMGKKVYVDIAGFYNHFHNLFSEDLLGTPFLETDPAPTHLLLPAQFGNGVIGNTKGFEIAPEWRPLEFWRLRASYSYLHMNLRRGPGSMDLGTPPATMGSSPHHQIFLDSGFTWTHRFDLDLIYRYVSNLPSQDVRAYSTADADFTWHMTRAFDLALVGRNLLQPYHAEYVGDPGGPVYIKREGYLKLTLTR